MIKETLASINGASVASALARMNLDTDVTKPARVPLGLSAAADTLNRLSVAQTRDEKIALLKLAETQVRSVLNETRSATDASVWLEASEKLREIQRRRAQLHEQQDVDVLHAIQSGGITKMLRRFARFSLKGGAAHSSTTQAQPRLQIWSALSTSDDSPLHARIAQSLQKRAELLVSEVPSDATQFAQLGDAVILVVNSQGADAGEQFRKAAEACSTSSTPLVVLDQTYSPGFRNLVLSVGNAQYYPDASALDSDGILNIIGHTPRRGTRTDFAVAPSTSLDKAKLRTRDNS